MNSAPTALAVPPDVARLDAAIAKLRHRIAELEAFRPEEIEERNDPSIARLTKAIEDTLLEIFGPDTEAYKQMSAAKTIDTAPYMLGGTPVGLVRHGLEQGKATAIALLQQAALSLEEKIGISLTAAASAPPSAEAAQPPSARWTEASPAPPAPSPPPASPQMGPPAATAAAAMPTMPVPPPSSGPARDLVVAYPPGEAAGEEIARFLGRTEVGAVGRYESAPAGPTDIEALERHSGIGFAVMLLPSGQEPGRHKALTELFYFIGKLGRRKICVLTKEAGDAPPVAGIVCAPFDPYEGWQKVVLRALEGAGYRIDWGKVLR
jgi:hypothetical protein